MNVNKVAIEILSFGGMTELAPSGIEQSVSDEEIALMKIEPEDDTDFPWAYCIKGSSTERMMFEIVAGSSPLQVVPDFLRFVRDKIKKTVSQVTKEDIKGYLEDSGFDVNKLETLLGLVKRPEWLSELSHEQYVRERV